MAFAEDNDGPKADDWRKQLEPDRMLGAFGSPRSDLPVGGAAALTAHLTVPGGELPAAAVTGVGVRPDYRRRGILTSLMHRQLADIRERGEPLAVLWASEGAIYQRFGYGMATIDGYLELDPRRMAFARELPAEGRVRIVEEAESAQLIPPVYEVMRARTAGALSRTETWWTSGVLADPEHSRLGASKKYRAVFEADGRPEGYAIYRIKSDWDHLGPKAVLEVREAVTTTPRALRGLWRYLFDIDLIRTVKVHHAQVPNPLQHVLAEPRALGLAVGDGLWVRLVDLPAALAGRRYGNADELVLEVSDRTCAPNAGRWRIRTTGTPGQTEAAIEAVDAEADLALDVAELGAVYLGGTRLLDLAAAGRVDERTPGAAARGDALFAGQHTPWCMSMF